MTGFPPAGYFTERTDERVGTMGTRWTRWGADRLARRYPPSIPSYHLRVERRRFMRWEVVAYQNRLEKA
jgi:hypothetical protein